jgi:5'-methylthioadenosine phosphorylase
MATAPEVDRPNGELSPSPSDDTRPIGVVGGTSLLRSSLFSGLKRTTVSTEYGDASVYVGTMGQNARPVVFLQRHIAGADHMVYEPPHAINHRRSFAALGKLRVRCVVGMCSVGSLHLDVPIGTLILPDDYFYLFGPPVSFYDDERSHIVPGIHAGLRSEIMQILGDANTPRLYKGSATYVQTTGPRFETPAEVKFLATLGHVVGMTAASEATVTAELKIPYAIVAMIDNFANGLDHKLTTEEFLGNVKHNQANVENAVSHILNKITFSPTSNSQP